MLKATYVEELGAKLKSFPDRYSNKLELDHCGEVLKNSIVSAVENSCRLRLKPVQIRVPWWNHIVKALKEETQKIIISLRKGIIQPIEKLLEMLKESKKRKSKELKARARKAIARA